MGEAKQQIMREELRAEVERLTGMLAAVCQHHRRHRDHTRHELREALPRHPGRLRGVPHLRARRARRRPPSTGRTSPMRPSGWPPRARTSTASCSPSSTALLAGDVAGAGELELAVRFQQVSAPVMAKGVEDTAFYRYQRLVSLNEVGGDPGTFGTAVADFHHANERAAARHPRGMLTLSTHDTKRSNDVRARIHLLSELAAPWAAAVERMARAHRAPPERRARRVDRAAPVPDARRGVADHRRAPRGLRAEGDQGGEGPHVVDEPRPGLRRGRAHVRRGRPGRRRRDRRRGAVPRRPPHRRARAG